jgi:hypothetical protein
MEFVFPKQFKKIIVHSKNVIWHFGQPPLTFVLFDDTVYILIAYFFAT